MQALVSVIIPVYNVEKFLDRCVRSVLAQTYNNLEIILVDDGSPDRSGEMCDSLAKEDSRIVVFHKQNGGVSDARNYGTTHAKGEYITFVDSDDYVAPNYVEYLMSLITKYDADTSCCCLSRTMKPQIPEGSHIMFRIISPSCQFLANLQKCSNKKITFV